MQYTHSYPMRTDIKDALVDGARHPYMVLQRDHESHCAFEIMREYVFAPCTLYRRAKAAARAKPKPSLQVDGPQKKKQKMGRQSPGIVLQFHFD